MTTAAHKDIKHHKQRTRKDILVRRLVTLCSSIVLILLAVLIWHLFTQTAQLFFSPSIEPVRSYNLTSDPVVGVGDVSEGGLVITKLKPAEPRPCGVELSQFVPLPKVVSRFIRSCQHTIEILEDGGQQWLFDVSVEGQVRIYDIGNQNGTNKPFELPDFSFSLPTHIWQNNSAYDFAVSAGSFSIRVSNADSHHLFHVDARRPRLVTDTRVPSDKKVQLLPALGLYLVFDDKYFTLLNSMGAPLQSDALPKPIQWIATSVGNRSVYMSYGDNRLTRYVVYNDAGTLNLAKTYDISLKEGESPFELDVQGASNIGVLLTTQSRLYLFNRVSGDVLNDFQFDELPLSLALFGQQIYIRFADQISAYRLENPAGSLTLKSLFKPSHYEGYQNPEHIYQTSAGSDFVEAKYSLVPLFIGSFKAALSALGLAIPLALGASIYTGFFARSSWRNGVKPIIEMLEAIPSVVIGFIAAIVLVPLAERLLVAFALFLVSIPVLLFVMAFFQHVLARRLPHRFRFGTEVITAIFGILIWGFVCLTISPQSVATSLFDGFSKTTLVVAVALGLAIAPTIYSIAEDAVSAVPSSMTFASFALGASRVQTLNRIVLRVAMPGILAACMLGFGRAFGETMIVLMVTGNTPIPDWSLLESLRALTANIAIELPEAEKGSVLYTLLFFTATTLFIFTFAFNTLAESLRIYMRKRIAYV